jgi:pimeloyl-ACP methyl ester carboxylesterase
VTLCLEGRCSIHLSYGTPLFILSNTAPHTMMEMLTGLLFLAYLQEPSSLFLDWMDKIAQKQLDDRDAAIRSITNADQAKTRQKQTRETVLKLIGGLPDYKGPLNGKTFGKVDAGDYTIEKVSFESLPQFVVTANLYLPKKAGKHPGILFPIGHWEQGKSAAQHMAGNFARKGFAVLAYDPIGQGERQQAYDPRTNRSLIGQGTEQHFMAGANAILIGESFARYRIWDAKRALDYLMSRPEVDNDRIGCTGCSGGGTITTYISALDPRIKVAAPACYMNSFRLVFTGPVGDSEQSPANFISSGLDETDYVEMFAPKPWLIGNTEEDFFTPAGAKIVYEEAKRWYNLFGAEDKIKWVVGPGGHGTPPVVREAIYDWMMRWLKVEGSAKDEKVPMFADHELWVTPKGQLAGKSREVYEVLREGLQNRKKSGTDLKAYLKDLVMAPEAAPPELRFQYKGPGSAQKVTLVVQTQGEASAQYKSLAEAGPAAFVTPRGLPVSTTPNLSGDWIANTRSWLIGRNLPAMRARDIIRAIDELERQHGTKEVLVEASDIPGVWALIAAVLDPRIKELHLERTPYSVRAAFETPIHRNLHDAVMPGFALLGDYEDLVRLIQPERKVIWKDPTDWMRNVIPLKGSLYTYSTFGH